MISRVLHPSYKLKFTNWLIDESFDGEGGELTCKLRDKVKSSLRSILKSIVVVEMRLTLAHKKLELNLAKGLRMILVFI